MDIQREQFDQMLGGNEELPTAVSIIKFINARSQEITALTEAIEEPQNNHLAFQKMPKHLRRRAMSHNVKRMPKTLREVHLSQFEKSGLPVKGKRPSRKYQRKPSNLLEEYNRRQHSAIWLETHIWHAKRFHMIQQWGYKLPLHSTNKGFRACYRATAKHCLLQDVSYFNCIELHGEEANIIQHLGQLTSPECGLTFAAKSTLSGIREGSVMVFKKGSSPFHAIGRVSFIWRPEKINSSRTLWIWCHPAFHEELVQELISLFQFQLEENTEMEVDSIDNDQNVVQSEVNFKKSHQKKEKPARKSVEKAKLELKNVTRLKKYSNGKETMILLKDTINRFRLTGPLSQIVLTEALKFIDINNFIKKEESLMDTDSNVDFKSAWVTEFYKDEFHLKCLQDQNNFWNSLKDINSAGEVPMRRIVAATVMDPRLSMPSMRTKAVNSANTQHQSTLPDNISFCSPLWETDVRNRVTDSKLTSDELNKLKSRALVPGLNTLEWMGLHNISHIPIILVQNPGEQSGYGSGWDVIFPASWSMPVWLGLVFRGARSGGIRENERLTLETASGPFLPPDTKAGIELSRHRQAQRTDTHFRLPPAKRPNFIKLGSFSPFFCCWHKLLQDWHPSNQQPQDAYVIRNRVQLEYLRCTLNKSKTTMHCVFSDSDKACGLVLVGVEACGRGTLNEGSMICAMTKKDIKLSKNKSGVGPTEPLHHDENEEKRNTLRENHLAKLKRLRKKRVKAKRMLEENDFYLTKSGNNHSKQSSTEELVNKHAEVMRQLWLPSEVNSVKNSCSRCVMGYITFGDFTFTKSKTTGYGYITLSSLLSYIENNHNHILTRKSTSLQYFFSRLKVL